MLRSVVCVKYLVPVLVVGLASGCGGGGTGEKKTFPVSGKVMFDGKPMVGGGSISFVPMAKKDARSAGGAINDDGTYSVMTYKEGDGAVPGEYRVVINQVTVKEPENKGDESPLPAVTASVAPNDVIPAIYSQENSPLTIKVEEKENKVDFDLKRNAGPPGGRQGGA